MAKLYGSVNGQTKQITKLYGSSEALTDISASAFGVTGEIGSLDRSVFLAGFLAAYPAYKWKSNGEISSVTCTRTSSIPPKYEVAITTTNGTITVSDINSTAITNTWGITPVAQGSGHNSYTITPSYTNQTREVAKLYGSASGLTKRIF